jgi:hypothetical protein
MCISLIGSAIHIMCCIIFTMLFLALAAFTVFVGVVDILDGYLFSGTFILIFVFIGLPLFLICLLSYHIHRVNRINEERNMWINYNSNSTLPPVNRPSAPPITPQRNVGETVIDMNPHSGTTVPPNTRNSTLLNEKNENIDV